MSRSPVSTSTAPLLTPGDGETTSLSDYYTIAAVMAESPDECEYIRFIGSLRSMDG